MPSFLQGFTFEKIRQKVVDDCGMCSQYQPSDDSDVKDFVVEQDEIPQKPINTDRVEGVPELRPSYTISRLVEVLIRRNAVRTTLKMNPSKTASLSEPNGTVRSIRQWAKECFGGDRRQERAFFEIIISSFLLTFFDEVSDDKSDDAFNGTFISEGDKSLFLKSKLGLLKLKRLRNSEEQLIICLLHGPGGSGKSPVCDEYC